MNRRTMTMLVSFILLSMILSISALASPERGGTAAASSTEATAETWSPVAESLLARARISSYSDTVNRTDERVTTNVTAAVYAYELSGSSVRNSFATSWIGNDEVAWDYWSVS